LHQLKAMNGIFYGVLLAVKVICMKASMNFKRLIIFHKAMKLQEKIDFVSI
jgi:hypothetical protein